MKTKPFSRLIHNIKVLGIKNGFRYWHLQNKSIRNPNFVLKWAERCELESESLKQKSPSESKLFFDWAKHLRKHHSDWQIDRQNQKTI